MEDRKINDLRRIRKTIQPLNLEMGKLPPQATDLEEAVLGAMMLEKYAVDDTIDILSADSFYKDTHQKIYAAILDLFQKSEPIDILTVTENLRKSGDLDFVGGAYYIASLTNKVASAANAEYHARIIAQKYIQRELIKVSSETIKMAYDDTTDVFDLLDKAESDLFKVAEGNIRKNYDKMSSLILQAVKKIEELGLQEEGISGIPSGFAALDRVTSGFQRSDMIVIAARPGMGKTAFVLSLARNCAVEFNRAVAVFSLEMSSLQLVNRLIASETELSAEKLRRGKLEPHEWEQLHAKLNRLSEAPIFIDDTPALSIFELRAKARRLKAQHNVDLIIIDYLQLMSGGNESRGNREQEISTISRSIKSIAKELDVPIIALSQLSRAVETRGGDKRPQLSDLRESGAIEQDADMVSFIYRPEYYGLLEDENGNSTAGMAEIIIAKHRNGALENVRLKFIPHLAKFEDETNHNSFITKEQKMPISSQFEDVGGNNVIRSSRINDEFEDDPPF
jgi:replicative DNA helicase